MNQRRYKKNKYRNRRVRSVIIISVAAVAVLFVIFMAVGLSLSKKTKDYKVAEDKFDHAQTDTTSNREVKAVSAYPLPLIEDGSSFASRLAGIKEGAKAVCVSLNKPDGTLLYRSSLASSLSYLSVESDASSLSTYINSIDAKDLYTTATLYIPTFKNLEDELLADVELSIWGSVACEAIRAGVGDVLLIASSAKSDDVEKLCALAERIHITEEKAVIGLILPQSVIDAEKSTSLIDTLSKSFDYLALDVTESKENLTLAENVENKIEKMQLQLMYYDMRVLLPIGASTEELDSLAKIVTKYSITSWQALALSN